MRSDSTVIGGLDQRICGKLPLHRERPAQILRRARSVLTLPPVDVLVIGERRIQLRRQQVRRQSVVEQERRSYVLVRRVKGVATYVTSVVATAADDGDFAKGTPESGADRRLVVHRICQAEARTDSAVPSRDHRAGVYRARPAARKA